MSEKNKSRLVRFWYINTEESIIELMKKEVKKK